MRPKTSFAGDIIRLASGTTLAQGVCFLAAPVLTRLYAPAQFGTLAVFETIFNILLSVACLRYEMAIVLPKSDEDGANVLAASILVLLGVVASVGGLLWILGDQVVRWTRNEEIRPFLWLLPVALCLSGSASVFGQWNSRRRQYLRQSVGAVAGTSTTLGCQVAVGLLGFTAAASLIYSRLIGLATMMALLGGMIWREDLVLLRKSVRWAAIRAALVRHAKFPLYTSWSSLLGILSLYLPVLLLAAYFSNVVVGFYALAMQVLKVPLNLLAGTVAQVFFQRAAEAHAEGKLAPLVEGMVHRLATVGMLPLLLLATSGDVLCAFALGPNWTEAGIYMQLLSPWMFMWFFSAPLSNVLYVTERQGFMLGYNLTVLPLRVIVFCFAATSGSARLAIAMLSITGLLGAGFLSASALRFAGVSLRTAVRSLARPFLLFVPGGAVIIVVKLLHASPLIVLILTLVIAVIYAALLIRDEEELRRRLFKRVRAAMSKA